MDVYAYWNLNQLWTVFNAAAALTGNSAYETLMFALILLGFLVVTGIALARFRAEQPIIWIVFLVFFHGILLVPKVSVNIIDRTGSSAPLVVPNVPLGLAFFASTTSQIGDWLTRSYESLMSIPGPVRFGGNGMMFGDRVIRAATQSVALDPRFNADLMEYVRNCVMPDLLDGSKDLNDLMQTEQIWAYMGNANPARATMVNFTTMICPDAYTALDGSMPTEVNRAHTHLARMLNPEAARTQPAGVLNGLLAAQIPVAADVVMGVTTANSYDMVRQAMMVNLWTRVPRSISQAVSDPVAGQMAIADAQAAASTEASYRSMANIAEGTLPAIRNSIQVLSIAIFPIILLWILMAGQNGGMILKTYVGALMWIELWPPLYAVVSFVMHSVSRDHISAGLAGYFTAPISASGMNLQNMSMLAHSVLSDQAIGGMLTLAVPVIALVLVTGSIFALSGAVGQIMAPATAAAQRFGGESGVGNLNLGNVRYETFAARQHAANSFQTSGSVDVGGLSTAAPTNTHTSAYGTTQQAAGQPGAPAVAKANVTDFGAGLAVGSGQTASHTASSGTGAQSSLVDSASNASTRGASFSQRDTADYARRFSEAVGDGIRTTTGRSINWGSGYERSAGRENGTGEDQTIRESGQVQSRFGVGGQGSFGTTQSQTAKPGGQDAAASSLNSGVPPKATTANQGLSGRVDAATGFNATATDELAYTARTGAKNSYGISQKQAAQILQDAQKTADAGTRDEAGRSAGRSFTADLNRGYATSQILTGTVGETSQAGEQTAASQTNTVGSSIRSDQQVLDFYAARTGLDPASAANSLNTLRSASPAAFAALVNEAREAYAASPDGQAALHQGGVGTPVSQQSVLKQGRQEAADVARAGNRIVDENAAANRNEVLGHQPFAADSQPDRAPVDAAYAATTGKADSLYADQARYGNVQRGVGLLTQQAVADNHGTFTPVRIAFAGWTVKSPQEIEGRIQYVVQNDPAVAAQVEHLGTLPAPSEKQYQGTAELIEASYARLTK